MNSPNVPERLLIADGDWQLLSTCRHHDPHGVYGWHHTESGSVVRTRQIGAERVQLHVEGREPVDMQPIGDDVYVAALPDTNSVAYELIITWSGGATVTRADGYCFLPTLGETDIHLINEGRHERLWEVLGARVRRYDTVLGTVIGTSFAVWAPNAAGVAVIGDFNGWNPSQTPMRALGSSGVWEVFVPGVYAGEVYKFAIHTHDGTRLDKADPMARLTEAPPATGSIVAESDYRWRDASWLEQRDDTDWDASPMSIYEVHLGSWKYGLSYAELAVELVDYVADMGYTHVEFMPVAEHPFGGSWGYQVTGYYAPSSRWGTADEFRALVDAFHARGIGVLVDWVPAHFPKDEWALARFDGSALYEHPDWRRGEQLDWGTCVFDFGRPEVRNFLVANALYWLEEFHIDGLRVDAVASMLYLDYSRKEGEWLPNIHGGREHLEAVQFLQEMNATVHRHHPGALTIAEESTSWPGVTAPTTEGGLGFSMKWNMGWMNDTLRYFGEDPINRSWHHNEITFSLVYAFSEKFILPISHDEVVHGKGSLWERMPGDSWNKAAGARTLLAYMWAHPGKQLLFQGLEWAQTSEWSESRSLDWGNLFGWEGEYHTGVRDLVRDMNHRYVDEPALYTRDFTGDGFDWVKADDAENNILAFLRHGAGGEELLCVSNLGGNSQLSYTFGLPVGGDWELVLNTDSADYAGAGNDLRQVIHADDYGWDGKPHSVTLHVPAMSTQWYRHRG